MKKITPGSDLLLFKLTAWIKQLGDHQLFFYFLLRLGASVHPHYSSVVCPGKGAKIIFLNGLNLVWPDRHFKCDEFYHIFRSSHPNKFRGFGCSLAWCVLSPPIPRTAAKLHQGKLFLLFPLAFPSSLASVTDEQRGYNPFETSKSKEPKP